MSLPNPVTAVSRIAGPWSKRRVLGATALAFCALYLLSGASLSNGVIPNTYTPNGRAPTTPKWPQKNAHGKYLSAPPTFEAYSKWELSLPQHNLDLPFPEGRHGRYVKFTNQIQGLGWNNILNELILNTHTAYRAGRAYVWDIFVWKPEYFPWVTDQRTGEGWTSDFPRTPLSTLIGGPTVGGPWEDGDPAPRSISSEWWPKVCPEEDIHTIWTDDAKPAVEGKPGNVVMDYWVDLIKNAPKRCVEIRGGPSTDDPYWQTYDLWLLGGENIIPMWKELKTAPASRLFTTSPLVNFGLAHNEHLFYASTTHDHPYDHMMAIHIRRGDYAEACEDLAKYSASFYGLAQLPFLPDSFRVPPSPAENDQAARARNREIYMKRCFPDLDIIREKIRKSKREWISAGDGDRTLNIMYLLTNAKHQFVEDFKLAMKEDGWPLVVTSQDLELNEETSGVDMAIDMEIARRAAVFIGNGWSSLTSNVLHRRLVDERAPISNRFW